MVKTECSAQVTIYILNIEIDSVDVDRGRRAIVLPAVSPPLLRRRPPAVARNSADDAAHVRSYAKIQDLKVFGF